MLFDMIGVVTASLRIGNFLEVGHVACRQWFPAIRGFGNVGGWSSVFLLLHR